jgi:hypothetical protein
MKPLMFDGEIRALERALLSLSGRPLRILEWGSGGSTVHFTKFLREHSIPYEWVSVEYNKGWAERVTAELAGDPHTRVVLFDSGNNDILQPESSMDEYVHYPKTLGQKFDFILVDGRKRRRCLLEARELVKPYGFVFLHDAQRAYYHSAFSAYPRGRFVAGRLWMGLTTPPNPLTWFFDAPRSVYEQFVFEFEQYTFMLLRNAWKVYAATPLRSLIRSFYAQ